MTENGFLPKPGSISSEQTEDSARSDSILALGRKLVEELEMEPSVDTLGRWMAHYVADLIVTAENATGCEKSLTEKQCFDAILELWRHRAELPNGRRPFEEVEPIIRAVESLDPEDVRPRYFRSVHAQRAKGEEESEASSWLEVASGLDDAARILIGYCLGRAAHTAIDKSKEWVKLAERAGLEDGVPEIVIRFVSSNADLGGDADPNMKLRQLLQERQKRLEAVTKFADALARHLEARLEALPSPKDGDGEEPS